MLIISMVVPNCLGDELGLKKGDKITHFNGNVITDILDYIYYDGQNEFTMTCKSGRELIDFEIEKDDFESLGLEFEDKLSTICCNNRCMFCFVHQLPNGMRKSLYIKDDDWRQSLVFGNYVTLTNISEKDLARIISMRMSPLFISVHTTNGELRQRMLQNKRADEIMPLLNKLSDNSILTHCQIVLCNGINSGEELKRTLEDLLTVSGVLSVAVVPVGLTKHRKGLAKLSLVDKECAIETIEICKKHKNVFCSDEMYLKAELPVLKYDDYGDFSQLENGVGLIAKFENEVYSYPVPLTKNKKISLVTGQSAKETIVRAGQYIMKTNTDLRVQVFPIVNSFFGESITVTGLVTGNDIISQLSQKDLGEVLVVPRVMLREFETVFLDNVSIADIEEKLSVSVRICDGSGEDFIRKITE